MALHASETFKTISELHEQHPDLTILAVTDPTCNCYISNPSLTPKAVLSKHNWFLPDQNLAGVGLACVSMNNIEIYFDASILCSLSIL